MEKRTYKPKDIRALPLISAGADPAVIPPPLEVFPLRRAIVPALCDVLGYEPQPLSREAFETLSRDALLPAMLKLCGELPDIQLVSDGYPKMPAGTRRGQAVPAGLLIYILVFVARVYAASPLSRWQVGGVFQGVSLPLRFDLAGDRAWVGLTPRQCDSLNMGITLYFNGV